MGTGRGEGSTDGMMTAADVADTVLYCADASDGLALRRGWAVR